jgi:hypothetical protein
MDYRIIYLFIAVLGLFALGCNKTGKGEKAAVDFEVYDQDKFADILFDLTMVEAAYRINMADVEAGTKRKEIYQNILLAHKTDSTVFNENWTYYGLRPQKMQEVYELVIKKIDSEREERGVQPVKKEDDEK